jgi:hypothetical protein
MRSEMIRDVIMAIADLKEIYVKTPAPGKSSVSR